MHMGRKKGKYHGKIISMEVEKLESSGDFPMEGISNKKSGLLFLFCED